MWPDLRRLAAVILLPVVVCQGVLAADWGEEHEVKAAVIYNLLLFVQWPEQTPAATKPRLCVLEDGALSLALRRHEGKLVGGKPLELRRVRADPEDLNACSAVVIEAGSSPAVLVQIGLLARTRAMLVIAEGAGTVNRGAMIGLNTSGGKVTFDINQGDMKRSGLVPSSKILRLARMLVE